MLTLGPSGPFFSRGAAMLMDLFFAMLGALCGYAVVKGMTSK